MNPGTAASVRSKQIFAARLLTVIERLVDPEVNTLRGLVEELNRCGQRSHQNKEWSYVLLRFFLDHHAPADLIARLHKQTPGVAARERFIHNRIQFATNLLVVIRQLIDEGVNTTPKLAAELNRRGVPSYNGGRWNHVGVWKLLRKYSPEIYDRLCSREIRHDRFLERMTPIIDQLQRIPVVGKMAVARRLNAEMIPTKSGRGRWSHKSVDRLMRRLRQVVDRAPLPDDAILTIRQFAARAEMSPKAVLAAVRAGELPSIKVGRNIMIPTAAVSLGKTM